MVDGKAVRVTHSYAQHNSAPPERVFPLLCPVREAEWVPGWQYRMIYSESGVAELGAVFTTPEADGAETTWLVTQYDPSAFRIGFVWVRPAMIATQLEIQLARSADNMTEADIRYTYTALSAAGEQQLKAYTTEWFTQKMCGWEAAINHYLRTGKRIGGAGWE